MEILVALTKDEIETLNVGGNLVKRIVFRSDTVQKDLVFSEFANQCLDWHFSEGESTLAQNVYAAYIEWCIGKGLTPLGKCKFYRLVETLEGVYKRPGGNNQHKLYNLTLI